MYQTYKDEGLQVLTILYQDAGYTTDVGDDDLDAWVAEFGLTYPVLADVNEQTWELYQESSQRPNLVLIDREMNVHHKDVGTNGHRAIEEMVPELL